MRTDFIILGLALLLFSASQAFAAPVRCAWVNNSDDTIVKFQTFEGNCPPSRLHKGIKWLPAPTVTPPTFNPDTQVREGPTHVVGASQVTQSYTVRSKTSQEIDDEKTAKVSGILEATFLALCRLENHDRVSDGKSAWTEAQCRAGFKTLLP